MDRIELAKRIINEEAEVIVGVAERVGEAFSLVVVFIEKRIVAQPQAVACPCHTDMRPSEEDHSHSAETETGSFSYTFHTPGSTFRQ